MTEREARLRIAVQSAARAEISLPGGAIVGCPIGSAYRRGPAHWRATVLATVAAGALCVTMDSAAAGPDACVVGPAGTVTCSGNQSGGIDAGLDFNPATTTTLIVNNLTQDIGSLSMAMEFVGPSARVKSRSISSATPAVSASVQLRQA